MDRLEAAGCSPVAQGWIEPGKAADIAFGLASDAARTALEGVFPGIDVVVQQAEGREKKAAMRGELDFEGALDARVALLAGLNEAVIERCLAERVTIMPGAVALIGTMRARGATAILVSGGFTRFAEPVAAQIGFHRAIANRLEIAGGVLSGTVTKPIVGSDTKLQTLLAAMAELNLPPEATLAVGDGANDLAMIRAAGLGVAYYAKPVVAAAADARIDQGDLSALLYAQGIPRAEWVGA